MTCFRAKTAKCTRQWGDPRGRPSPLDARPILGSGNFFDTFENIDGLVLSKEVLSFGTFGGLSFEEF